MDETQFEAQAREILDEAKKAEVDGKISRWQLRQIRRRTRSPDAVLLMRGSLLREHSITNPDGERVIDWGSVDWDAFFSRLEGFIQFLFDLFGGLS